MRSKVTLLATALVAAVLVVSAFGLIGVQQQVLTHGIDEALRQRADNLQPDIVRGAFGSSLPGEGDPEDSFLQLIGPDGSVVAASDNAVPLTPVIDPQSTAQGQLITSVDGIGSNNDDFRVLARDVGRADEPQILVVAKNLDDVHESVRILATSLAISIPVVTALLALLLWWLTGRVLRSVESIRSEVASIGGSELHRRVPTSTAGDEITRLAHTMNAMLDRVEQATERQRRFVADASHELRGPLTRIRSSLEVSLVHPDTRKPAELHQELLADTADLQKLVDDLLFLARSESGSFGGPQDVVDLDDLVLEEARQLRERALVQVDTTSVSAARTLGDAHQLARAIRNLASNAERHARSVVSLELREADGRSTLVVADDGPGIPAEHHETVFKRFTRLDEARSRDSGGSGLGLAIVHDIVVRHHGSIAIEPSANGGARFVLDLPRAE